MSLSSPDGGTENMNLFAEISRTNAAHCAALGLSPSDLYGTPPNERELKTHRLIKAGVPADAADPYMDRVRSENLRVRKIVARQRRDNRTLLKLYPRGYPTEPFRRLALIETMIKVKA